MEVQIKKITTQSIYALLESCLDQGILRIGEIEFTKKLQLFHHKDRGCNELKIYEGAEAAREIARYDAGGGYRPLKTAPNLPRGWELRVASIKELHLALDYFYPAAIGLWLELLRNTFSSTPLRNTLSRQSGMYCITAKITDEQAQQLIESFCGKSCLRCIGWDLTNSKKIVFQTLRGSEIPLICPEACHLFISEARRLIKAKL